MRAYGDILVIRTTLESAHFGGEPSSMCYLLDNTIGQPE